MGPFAGHSPDERLLLAQSFVGVACLTGLVLAAVITERKRAEDNFEYIADTLQESLLPARLPEIPGLESAVEFHPAGERHGVEGDFYDLFQREDGSWAIVVGDVCGKGAAAAAVTGLARYTLRAAAIEEARSRILGLLNDALLRQRGSEEFCTVAYAGLELDGAEGARVTVSCGGHPLPLVLRAGGAVEPLGGFGHFARSRPQSRADGPHSQTGERRRARALHRRADRRLRPRPSADSADLVSILQPCAGQSAPDIARGIRDAVLDGSVTQPRDDIALLVPRLTDVPSGPEAEITRLLPNDAHAAALAREAIGELEPALGPRLLGTVRLLVSEIVTNSVRHASADAGDTIELRARVFPDRLRVEVSDRGSGFRRRAQAPDRLSVGGWGLYIVDQFADNWGVLRDDATRVWFEIKRGGSGF